MSPDFIDSKLQNYSNISSGGERVITPENDAHWCEIYGPAPSSD